jgi:hypothetical protein
MQRNEGGTVRMSEKVVTAADLDDVEPARSSAVIRAGPALVVGSRRGGDPLETDERQRLGFLALNLKTEVDGFTDPLHQFVE